MKVSATFPPRMEWGEFFGLLKGVNPILRQKAEDIIVNRRIAELPEGHGFGSSDRWHTIIGSELSSPHYDEETKQFSLPETAEEMEERVKSFLRFEMTTEMGFTEHMVNAFLEDPQSFVEFFSAAVKD